MGSFKQIENKILIDGEEIPLDVFKILEPSYSPQVGTEAISYDGSTLFVRVNGVTNSLSGLRLSSDCNWCFHI